MYISLAQLSDIPELSKLLALLFSQETEFCPDFDKQCQGLQSIITNPETGHILVARQDNRTIGMVSLLYTVSTALGAKVALLEDMVTAPDARRSGIGSALLHGAIEYARKQGCQRITLLTDHDNHRAQAFYRQHGFVLSPMVPMRLKLDG